MLKPGMYISDRYEIIDKVGSGGMADVYKAKDQRLNRNVAIKILKPEYSSDKVFVNKFRGEAQSAAGLSHPNIVNVYDVGDDSGLHYIVMELVEGITLKRFIERKGKLEVKEAVGIAIQIALGMEAAHDNHIIHRDIKPQNIIISKEGKVKVTDFGIAKATTSNTITSNAMGSVHYLSPEQARGGYSDEKSDIYSLGVTIYEMLSGKVPFAGDNTVSVALLHIQGEAIPLRELDPKIPVSIDKIVQKCMQKRPERRYHTASELIGDLRKAIAYPDGDFVQIPAFIASDSPTINISEDIDRIKNGAYLKNDDMKDTKKDIPGKLIEEEDEELDTVDTKLEKFTTIGSIAAAVLLLALIIFLVIMFVFPRGGKESGDKNENLTPTSTVTIEPSPSGTSGETYKVPSVIGLTKMDAEDSIKAKDPNANIIYKEDYSDKYDVGEVMAQYPQAENEVEKSSQVTLTISTGKKSFTVPNVYNLTEEKADKILTEKGLVLQHEYVSNNDIEDGRVISTKPERNTNVVNGDTITVTVSTGPDNKQIVVPNIIGSTLKQAEATLKNLGLKIGDKSYESSDTYEKDKITYQSNTAGQKVNAGTAIDIIISTGLDSSDSKGNTRYIGQVTIDVNPFDYINKSQADITLELDQDGWVTNIKDEVLDKNSFPLTVKGIEGESASAGIVRMYVDGELFKLPGSSKEKTWTVKFEAVED